MTIYLNMESKEQAAQLSSDYEVIIVGGGAAGLTIARELAEHHIRICVVESGSLGETPETEALNAVEVTGYLEDPRVQVMREGWHGWQTKFWSANVQKYGLRTRGLGGSTSAWGGKVSLFDEVDFAARDWIPHSGWPIGQGELAPYTERGAERLGLGPLVNDERFWQAAGRTAPEPLTRMKHYRSFFWQFARSGYAMTDVLRFGPDFQRKNFESVTVLLNATVASVVLTNGRASGVSVISSLSGANKLRIGGPIVVVAAGAIENTRILLLSGLAEPDATAPAGRPALGRYLIDHPALPLGTFDKTSCDEAARLLGFYSLQQHHRTFMYLHGLSLRPDAQQAFGLPNIAAYAVPKLSEDDPRAAFLRLAKLKSDRPLRDLEAIVGNLGVIVTAVGRKVLESPKVPLAIRRWITDAAVRIDPNLVARDYLAAGGSRKLDGLMLALILEQPPHRDNCIILSRSRDRLGLPKVEVHWEVDDDLKAGILKAGELIVADLERAGITGFHPEPAFFARDASQLLAIDQAHTGGTTRMGVDPETSVVDVDCQVHGVPGLYVAGASVFPTIGHANPTLLIVAMAVRLADRLLSDIKTKKRTRAMTDAAVSGDAPRPLVLVTGATGRLGRPVVDELCNRGYRVRAQYRRRAPDDDRVEWICIDFSDPDLAVEKLDGALVGVSAVIHLAASLTHQLEEMETTNVVNLERLADACVRAGVRCFAQASSMVVYGSPRVGLVTEETPLIDPSRPLEGQFLADDRLRAYARSKRIGEDILRRHGDRMHVDLCRIAVADPGIEENALEWGTVRRVFMLQGNSHLLATRTVARAFVHLVERSLAAGSNGVEAYNICDSDSPTFAELYRRAGRPTGSYIPLAYSPLAFEYLRGVKVTKRLTLRRPQSSFRMDDGKLKRTGFRDA